MHTSRTRLLAVIGDPIEHSMSPAIHGSAIAHAGIDFAYVAFRVADAREAVAAMRALDIRGFSVTIPHKESVIPHLDDLDISARRTGSVNTIINDNGRLKGYSTDGAGAIKALAAAGVAVRGKNVLVIGTGGAARALVFSLVDEGVGSIRFQSIEKAQEARLAADLDAASRGVVVGESEPDVVINASPIGMSPKDDVSPFDPTCLAPGAAVFDVVYNPIRTRLLREADLAGLVTVEGVSMFVEQAALQFELFTGSAAPREVMERTVRERLRKSD